MSSHGTYDVNDVTEVIITNKEVSDLAVLILCIFISYIFL
jgi:hypothetical protein